MQLAGRYRNTLVLAVGLLVWSSTPGMAWPTVLIKMNGVNITNKTQSTIVGRRIPLTGEVIGGTPTTKSWSIPGNPIKGYAASSVSAKVTNLSSSDLQQSSVAFYWVDGGSGREVTYTVTVNGQIYSGKTTFNVKRPTATLTTTTGSVTISGAHGVLAMSFGVPPPGNPGITFSASVTEPSGFSGGSGAWFQVVDSTYRRYQENGGDWYMLSGSKVCDSLFPYPGGYTTNDSPLVGLSVDIQQRCVCDEYAMHLMYKPTGTAIWVPLRKVEWYWSGHAVRNGANWNLESSSHSTNPGSVDWTTPPTWSGNVTSLTYQKE
jgi:hypothetical protein